MKLSRALFIVGLMLITTIQTNAQTENLNEINSLSTEIFSLINNINDNVDEFFDAENTKRLSRELDYFQNDLKRYLIARKELMVVLYPLEQVHVLFEVKILREEFF